MFFRFPLVVPFWNEADLNTTAGIERCGVSAV